MNEIEEFKERVSELLAEYWAQGHDGCDLVDALVDQAVIEGETEKDFTILSRASYRHLKQKI